MSLDKDDIPLHFEGVRLRPAVEGGGWLIAAVLTVGGVGLAATAGGWAAEAFGVAAAGIGGAGLVGLVRCRQFETVLNRRFLSGAAGPLRGRLPVGFIEGVAIRAATSWRRLYSDREVVVETPSHIRTLVVPSREPKALIDAIQSVESRKSKVES